MNKIEKILSDVDKINYKLDYQKYGDVIIWLNSKPEINIKDENCKKNIKLMFFLEKEVERAKKEWINNNKNILTLKKMYNVDMKYDLLHKLIVLNNENDVIFEFIFYTEEDLNEYYKECIGQKNIKNISNDDYYLKNL